MELYLNNPVFINNIVLLLLAISTLYNTWLTNSARNAIVATRELAIKTELNTNSMKDDLVKAIKDASHSSGLEQGRKESAIEAALVAKGKLSGMKEQINGIAH